MISTSLRAGSNSDMLADKFMEGALQAGHEVEKISLIGKDIRFCRGCLACQKLGKCVIQDDVDAIMQILLYTIIRKYISFVHYLTRKTHPAGNGRLHCDGRFYLPPRPPRTGVWLGLVTAHHARTSLWTGGLPPRPQSAGITRTDAHPIPEDTAA